MRSFTILMNKEYVQMLRDFKIVWLPLVFIFLGATQPIITYYLPAILEGLGGTEGISIDPSMTAQQGGDVLAATLGSQFDQLGVIIIVISMMAIVQADKANGMLSFILTRPVKVKSYILGKIVSNYLFTIVCVGLGYLVSYAYVRYLFNPIPVDILLIAFILYVIWVLFMVSFTTMVSTIFNGQGIIALLAIVSLIVSRLLVGLHPSIDFLNPATVSQRAIEVLILGEINSQVYENIVIAFLWIFLTILICHYWIFKKKYH